MENIKPGDIVTIKADLATIKADKNNISISYTSQKEFKFGNLVLLDFAFPKYGAVLSKIDDTTYKVFGVNGVEYNVPVQNMEEVQTKEDYDEVTRLLRSDNYELDFINQEMADRFTFGDYVKTDKDYGIFIVAMGLKSHIFTTDNKYIDCDSESLNPVCSYEVDIINKFLKSNSLFLDFDKNMIRSKSTDIYYFISDCGTIVGVHNAIDDRHLECGNYFSTEEDAKEAIKKIREVLNASKK